MSRAQNWCQYKTSRVDSGPGNTLVHPGIPWKGQILSGFFSRFTGLTLQSLKLSLYWVFFGFSLFSIEFIYDLCIRITF